MALGDGGYLDQPFRVPLGSNGTWGTMGPWGYTGTSRGDNEINVQGEQVVTINGKQYYRTGSSEPPGRAAQYLQPGDFSVHPQYGGIISQEGLSRIPPESGFWNGAGPALLAMAAVGGVTALGALGGAGASSGVGGGELLGAGETLGGGELIGAGEALGGEAGAGIVGGEGGSVVGENFFPDIIDDLGGGNWWGTDEGSIIDWLGTDETLAGDLPGFELPGGSGGITGNTGNWWDDLDLPNLPGSGGNFNWGKLFETGLSIGPSMAAIAYALGQDPYDTSRLEDIYDSYTPGIKGFQSDRRRLTGLFNQYDPEAMAQQYDINTGIGNERLTSGLARRQLTGSSFANADLANYSTSRDLGRNALINQGVTTQAGIGQMIANMDLDRERITNAGLAGQAGIANSIINAEALSQEQKNRLYSAALLAMSGGLSNSNSSWWT